VPIRLPCPQCRQPVIVLMSGLVLRLSFLHQIGTALCSRALRRGCVIASPAFAANTMGENEL
jgi:hypothetical protein